MTTPRVFLLSPAFCGGKRAGLLMNPASSFDLARRLQHGTLSLGEAFSFLSGLYFRGKLAYAQRFAHEDTFVITPTQGLRSPASLVDPGQLREFASVDVDAGDLRYRAPLERDLRSLERGLDSEARVILLGSIATPKYVDAIAGVFGPRLHYPPSFIGRGDMSRGGLLLRAARSGVELEYARLDPTSQRRGARPPRLEPLPPERTRTSGAGA